MVINISYSTAAQIHDITGITTTEISDSDMEEIITIADSQIDEEINVSLDSGKKTLASIYLTANLALKRLASTALGTGGSYSIGGLKVDNRSAAALRNEMASNFLAMYNTIVMYGDDGSAVRKIQSD